MTDPLTNVTSVLPALADDEDILAAAKSLVIASLQSAEELITSAAPPVREPLIRSLLPAAIKLLADRDSKESLDDLRSKMEEVLAGVKGEPAELPADVIQLPTEDTRS